ncbi:MAG: hypothetical protein E7679_04200 [Ruminococcaceae bacterium]|nr:hypothetical protein [Oscillospiraceae bacterium]
MSVTSFSFAQATQPLSTTDKNTLGTPSIIISASSVISCFLNNFIHTKIILSFLCRVNNSIAFSAFSYIYFSIFFVNLLKSLHKYDKIIKNIKMKGVFTMAKAKKTNSELFSSLLYILLGVLLVVFKSQTLGWAMTIAGIIFVISGALDLIKKNWAGGAVSLIIGIAILVLGWVAAKIVLLVLGIMIAIKGIVALINVFKQKKANALQIVFPILTVIVGLMLAFGNALDIMIIIVGILLIVDGILGFIGSLKK